MDTNPFQVRKIIRHQGYNYSSPGSYFITICSYQKQPLFTDNNSISQLTEFGKLIEFQWRQLPVLFTNISLGEYVIMPNHFHGILTIHEGEVRETATLGTMIGKFKADVTRAARQKYINFQIWQRRYFDRIIRNQSEYQAIENYIRSNPDNWLKDEYY